MRTPDLEASLSRLPTVPARHPAVIAVALLAACSSSARSPVAPTVSGALAVQVSGLPAGTDARVRVDGPGGFHQDLTGSATLSGLGQGGYVVSAGYVNAQNQTWTPQVALDSVGVTQGDTAQALVAYTGGPPPSENLRIAGVQLIQSSQRADGSVPMVGGRDALLRVFAVADSANTLRPAVRVRLFQGGTQVDSMDIPAPGGSVPLTADTSSLSASWNVLVPGARMKPGLQLQVVVDPEDVVPETDEGDNAWPAGAPQAVAVVNVPGFNLRFVPVKQTVNGLTGNVSAANQDALADLTRRMMPLGQVTLNVHATVSTDAPVLQSNDSNAAWSQILSEMSALRTAEGGGWDYVGVVQVTYASGIAGLGYVGAPAAVAWDKASTAPGV
ncbi:MAG TPA: hypothetical protein VNH46_08155, partial [Gemmatimonadales bacterium]|nr:hypothetical protein [Gemmatimonadales bacterium]